MKVEGWGGLREGWRGGGTTHRGCVQRSLADQVGVRNGHAEAQPRARLLHRRHRRLEVAGERRGGGGRGGGRVGGLRSETKRKKEEKVEKIVSQRNRGLGGERGC